MGKTETLKKSQHHNWASNGSTFVELFDRGA
jgi:hypothetical protein